MSDSVSSSATLTGEVASVQVFTGFAGAADQERVELASSAAAVFAEYIRSGDVVLDVRSGRGELCIALAARCDAQLLIGIETDVRALETARRAVATGAARGDEVERVRFARADVRNLAEDLEAQEHYVLANPVTDAESLADFRVWCETQRERAPAVAPSSCDLVLAHSLHRLPRPDDRRRALEQMFWAVKPGGRLVINEFVSDEPVPPLLQVERALLSSGLAGSFTEVGLARALTEVGYVGVRYARWQARAARVVAGIEFRAVTIEAVKPTGSECIDRGGAAIYRGPYAQVTDDEGHVFLRGERMAVCERTLAFLANGPYRHDFIAVPGQAGRAPVPWCAPAGTKRPASESKSALPPAACVPGGDCC